jgi:ParB family chromosome partitioning protein
MHPTHVTIDKLKLDDKANVRKTGRGADAAFIANISAKGILVPLTVRPNGDGYLVTNGGKRLSALQEIVKRKGVIALKGGNSVLAAEYEIPIHVRDENDADARDTSLAANIITAPMHPVDRYEAFAQRIKDGATPEQLQTDYAMTKLQVEQVLALGGLNQKIRDAWKAGEISAEVAQAFTIERDQKEQLRAFDKLSKTRSLSTFAIRRELKNDDRVAGALLELVGIEEYVKRGGKVTRDLFGSNHRVSDAKLLKKMVDEKIKQKLDELVKQGWSWAETEEAIGRVYSWERIHKRGEPTDAERAEINRLKGEVQEARALDKYALEDELLDKVRAIEDAINNRAFSDKDKKRSGCIVSLENGQLRIEYGYVKPEVKKAEVAQKKAKEKKKAEKSGKAPEPAGITNALALRISTAMTEAAADTLAEQPDLALAVLVAALGSSDCAIKLSTNGAVESDLPIDGDFHRELVKARKLNQKQLLERLAGYTASMIDMRGHSGESLPYGPKSEGNPDDAALLEALDQEELYGNLGERFDREDYFNSVSKDTLLAAIQEGVNKDEARKIASKPKAEIAAFAIDNVHQDWFPPELRTKFYEGPGAKKRKAA